MSDAVAGRLLDSTFTTPDGKKALSLGDLYDSLQGSIWSELKTGGDISLMRRNLQREHVLARNAANRGKPVALQIAKCAIVGDPNLPKIILKKRSWV